MIDLKGIDDYFIITSNTNGIINAKEVDFKKENFWEVYGNKHHFQCEHGKVFDYGTTNPFSIGYDKIECNCKDGGEAKPNVLNLNNFNFNPQRSDLQNSNFRNKIQQIIDSK
jgi:hypothetical protein